MAPNVGALAGLEEAHQIAVGRVQGVEAGQEARLRGRYHTRPGDARRRWIDQPLVR